ncbi:MAG: fatty acid desaturase [Caldilineaceae bacterium]|nr:fatty acid desaturase [Caldilineaceae bacterium]
MATNPNILSATEVKWRTLVAPYQQPNTQIGLWQLANSFGGLLLCWTLMYLSLRVGYWATLMPVIVLAGSVGTWLFYVQHQFERTYWEHTPQWDYTLAALHGSSYYKLPRLLQWFTGNIGFHHIHHLSPRIPNYHLQKCHDENPALQQVAQLTLKSSLQTIWLTLWDEEQRRLVSFREAAAMKKSVAVQSLAPNRLYSNAN